ncbi:hypothetical protein OU798_07540 [Prolixibacteraceae bacterium Z1-6]|uniref:Uncharacterized protein n=1 Tax=Draconibacterium aestuarii TaxID=2998507 RepID=A0A9X3F4G1_9BACT|nr:hypothetical protein [Prolixibacteraceae bacterium Z1-6]
MEPKEKAKELVKKFYNFVGGWTSTNRPNEAPSAQYEGEEMRIGRAKQCAFIVVDEILENSRRIIPILKDSNELVCSPDYWNQVKEEIRKINCETC